MDQVFGALGLLVGVLGLAYGLYQGRQMKQTRSLMLDHSLKMFRSAFTVMGFIQKSRADDAKESGAEALARAGSLAEELANDIAFHAAYFTDITDARIQYWINSRKLPPNSEPIMRNFIQEEELANYNLHPIPNSADAVREG